MFYYRSIDVSYNPVLQTVESRVPSFNFQHPLVSFSLSSSRLRLLQCLPRVKISHTLHEDLSTFYSCWLRCHTNIVCELNGIKLLEQPKRYKHHANAPDYQFIRTLPILLIFSVPTETSEPTTLLSVSQYNNEAPARM